MMEVTLCPFSEGTLQTVSCSCLNEKVVRSMETKRDMSTQHRHHIREDKNATHNKAERHIAQDRTGSR